MEEKEARKGVGSRTLKSTCKGMEEGSKGMFLPPKSTPLFGGPSNQVGKHHHKPKKV
jgi:hypothetical protein